MTTIRNTELTLASDNVRVLNVAGNVVGWVDHRPEGVYFKKADWSRGLAGVQQGAIATEHFLARAVSFAHDAPLSGAMGRAAAFAAIEGFVNRTTVAELRALIANLPDPAFIKAEVEIEMPDVSGILLYPAYRFFIAHDGGLTVDVHVTDKEITDVVDFDQEINKELLDALKEMRAAYGNCGSPRQQDAANAADAAIANATPKQH